MRRAVRAALQRAPGTRQREHRQAAGGVSQRGVQRPIVRRFLYADLRLVQGPDGPPQQGGRCPSRGRRPAGMGLRGPQGHAGEVRAPLVLVSEPRLEGAAGGAVSALRSSTFAQRSLAAMLAISEPCGSFGHRELPACSSTPFPGRNDLPRRDSTAAERTPKSCTAYRLWGASHRRRALRLSKAAHISCGSVARRDLVAESAHSGHRWRDVAAVHLERGVPVRGEPTPRSVRRLARHCQTPTPRRRLTQARGEGGEATVGVDVHRGRHGARSAVRARSVTCCETWQEPMMEPVSLGDDRG